MMGNNSGMMQRSFCELFARIDRMADTECIVTCSYYELYNEQIIDLLDKSRERKNLNIRQDVRKGVFVENLIEESALNSDKLLECLMTGMKNRHIGETQMNRESSRSHSIFTISLAIKSEIDGKKVLKTPKLHFVDLAGS
jgi:kinesin family member 15